MIRKVSLLALFALATVSRAQDDLAEDTVAAAEDVADVADDLAADASEETSVVV